MPLNDFIDIYFYPRDYVLYRELNSIILSMNYHDHKPGNGRPIPHGKSSDPFAAYGEVSNGSMSLLGTDNHHAKIHYLTMYDDYQTEFDKPHKTKVIRSEIGYSTITAKKVDVSGLVAGDAKSDQGKCVSPIGDDRAWDTKDGSILTSMVSDHVILANLPTDNKNEYNPSKTVTVANHVASLGKYAQTQKKISNKNPHGTSLSDLSGYLLLHSINTDSTNQLVIFDLFDLFKDTYNIRCVESWHPISSYYKTFMGIGMENTFDHAKTINNIYGRLKLSVPYKRSSTYMSMHVLDSIKVKYYPSLCRSSYPDDYIKQNYQQYKIQEAVLMDPHNPMVSCGSGINQSLVATQPFIYKLEPPNNGDQYEMGYWGAFRADYYGCIYPNSTMKTCISDFRYEDYSEHKYDQKNIWNYIKNDTEYKWGFERATTVLDCSEHIYNYGELINLSHLDNTSTYFSTYPINSYVDDSRFIYKWSTSADAWQKSFMLDYSLSTNPAYRQLRRRGTNSTIITITRKDQFDFVNLNPFLLFSPQRFNLGETIEDHEFTNVGLAGWVLHPKFEIDPGRYDMRMNWDMLSRDWAPTNSNRPAAYIKRVHRPCPPCYVQSIKNFPGKIAGSKMRQDIIDSYSFPSINSTNLVYKIHIPEITSDNERNLIIDITALIQEYDEGTGEGCNLYNRWGGPLLSIDLWAIESANGRITAPNVASYPIWTNVSSPADEYSHILPNYQFMRFLGSKTRAEKNTNDIVKRGIREIKIFNSSHFTDQCLEKGYYLLNIRPTHSREIYGIDWLDKSFLYYCWINEHPGDNDENKDNPNNEYYIKTGALNPVFSLAQFRDSFPEKSNTGRLQYTRCYKSINIQSINIKIGKALGSEDSEQFYHKV